jgi:hypothetical protein
MTVKQEVLNILILKHYQYKGITKMYEDNPKYKAIDEQLGITHCYHCADSMNPMQSYVVWYDAKMIKVYVCNICRNEYKYSDYPVRGLHFGDNS